MSDRLSPLVPHPDAEVADEATRERRHQVLRDLLGAYGDRELPPETTAQIDAHLIGCARCREELQIHDAIRARLTAEPPAAASPALRVRIASALDARPAAPSVPSDDSGVADAARFRRVLTAVALGGWTLAVALGALAWPRVSVQLQRGTASADVRTLASPTREVPLLDGILEDYTRVSAGYLPGRARDLATVRAAVAFPVEPLRTSGLRLLGAWTTDVRGEPAAVLAYRLDDRLVVQYLVAEDAFFRHPGVRTAISAHHLLTASDGPRTLVAWPEAEAGSVLVGDVPPSWLVALWSTARPR